MSKPMTAYWVARAKVNKPDSYKRYTDRVGEVIARYGGTVLARGGRYQIMEGPDTFHRFVVIEFPDFEAAVNAYQSAEYQAIKQYRSGAVGEVETVIVAAGDATPV